MGTSDGPLQIYPAELKFRFELRKQVPTSLQLFNPGDVPVAFKVRPFSDLPHQPCIVSRKTALFGLRCLCSRVRYVHLRSVFVVYVRVFFVATQRGSITLLTPALDNDNKDLVCLISPSGVEHILVQPSIISSSRSFEFDFWIVAIVV